MPKQSCLNCHPEPFVPCHSEEPFACCHSERSEESGAAQDKLRDEESGEKRVLNEVKELKLLRFTQDKLRILLRVNSVKGKGL